MLLAAVDEAPVKRDVATEAGKTESAAGKRTAMLELFAELGVW
jgi:hypothetical protein